MRNAGQGSNREDIVGEVVIILSTAPFIGAGTGGGGSRGGHPPNHIVGGAGISFRPPTFCNVTKF